MSKAQYAMKRLSMNNDSLAAKVGVSSSIVSHWLNGNKQPTLKSRKLIEAALGIPAGDWDVVATYNPAPLPSPPAIEDNSIAGRIVAVESMIDNLMTSARNDTQSTPLEQAKVMQALSSAIGSLRRLKGEEIAEVKVVRHPKWLELQKVILDALQPHPEALDAVIEAIGTSEIK